jgi:ubiquinone/menaquinone biosynthesis C-methylase UbiE
VEGPGSAAGGDLEGFGYWYDEKQQETGDLWHRTLIDPGLFTRIGSLAPGIRVLDLGCGNGYIARRLARAGAQVVGVDRSPASVERARETAQPLGIAYHLADAANLGMIPATGFDLVIANMSLMDIADGAGAIREAARVLVPGGRFIFSISHPCFDIDTRSAWVLEGSSGTWAVFRKVTAYRQPHEDRYAWNLKDGRTAYTSGHHRPLSWYVKELHRDGFAIVDLEEPSPGPDYGIQKVRQEWLEQIPLHLVVEARRELPPGTPP